MSIDHIMLKSESNVFVTFSVDGTEYSMIIHHERTHEENNFNHMQESVSADIEVGAKKITLVKRKNGDSAPTFNISGEGQELQEERQCKIVLANCISVVIQQIDAWQQNETEDAMREFLSPIINFILLFNHFFGDYVADIATMEVGAVEAATRGGFYEYSSFLCLLVTTLSLTTTAESDKLKAFARVAVVSTAITKFN